MTFTVGTDGEAEFKCHGCGKKSTTRNLKTLPKGWLLTGILKIATDEEWAGAEGMEEAQVQYDAKMRKAGSLIGAHFCSMKCAKKKLLSEESKDKIQKAGISLAVFGQVTLLVDGAKALEPTEGGDDDDDDPADGWKKGEIPPHKEGE